MKNKINVKSNSGITLIALVITIIVLLILATVATYSGIEAIDNTKMTAFTAELKIMQTHVNELYDKYTNGGSVTITENDGSTTTYTGDEILNLGEDLSDDKKDFVLNKGGTNTGFKLYSNKLIQKLGIEGTKQDFYINIPERELISVKGLKYKGNMYYTLNELPDGFYNVEYKDKNTEKPQIGSVDITSLDDYSWKFMVNNITYGGYVNKGKVLYKKDGTTTWKETEDDYFIVKEPGKYNVKVVDSAGNESDTKVAYAYAKNGLILYYDGINNTRNGHNTSSTIWEDLSGNNNDGELVGFNEDNLTCWNNDSLEFNKDNWGEYVEVDNITGLPEEYAIQIVLEHSGEVQDTSYNCSSIISTRGGYWWYDETQNDGKGFEIFAKTNDVSITLEDSEGNNFYKLHNPGTAISLSPNQRSAILLNKYPEKIELYKDKDTKYQADTNKINATEFSKKLVINGRRGNAGFWQFKGNISSVRIYNRALTEEEIITNYEIDRERFNITE